MILVWGKARNRRVPHLGCRGAESPGSSIFVGCSPHTYNILRCSTCCRPCRMWVTFSRFSPLFEVFVSHSYSRCTHCIVPENLPNHLNSFCGGMLQFNTKSDTRSLFYSLSHFEFYGHTIHMLTQWPPLTSTVKSSLFMHAHSSPLSSAARLHRCRANHPRYINNGWTFSGQTLYVYLYVCIMEARKL